MATSKKIHLKTKEQLSDSVAENMIRQRAYEIYEMSDRQDGRDVEHWLQAQAEIMEEIKLQDTA
jgi:hypothetical protein